MPAINITPLASTGSTDALALANTLMGTGVTVTSATIGGTAAQAGTFSGAIASSSPAWTAIDSGAVFSSGNAVDLIGATSSTNRNVNIGSSLDNDAKFNVLANGFGSFDVSYIDITFIPTNASLTIQFLFGSEEYNEYVYSNFSDAIGIWVNNTNIALTPEGKPISINTINQAGTYTPSQGTPGPSAAPSLYVNNSTGTYSTPLDGLTRTLGATIAVNAGVANTIRLGVADVGDGSLDSWLLVKADSVQASTVAFNDNVVTPLNTNVIIDVTANDFTDTGNPLTTIAIADQTAVVNTPITLTSGATVTLQPDGTLLYQPVTNSTANDLFTYTVFDGIGNTSTGFVNVAVGLTGPVVNSQTTLDTTPVISGTTSTGAALNSGEVMKVTINGATYTVVPDSSGNWSVDLGTASPSSGSLTPLSTGTYDVTATITNGASVAVDNSHSELIIGSSAPVAPTVNSQTTNDTTPVITGTIGGATALLSGEVLTVTVSGATYTVTPDSSGNWSLDLGTATPTSGTLTPLSNSTYSVTATVTNSGSTATSDSTSNELIIDTVAPVAPTVVSQTTNDTTPILTGTIGGGTTLGSGEVLTITVSGATYTVTPDSSGNWSLDLGTATPTSGTLTPLANGTYPVTATITDAGGNATSDSTSNELIIDTVAPVAPTVVSQITNDTTPIITGTIGGGTTLGSGEVLTVTVSGATYTVTPDSSGNWSLDLGTATPTSGTLTPLANGTYPVTATITDAGGNATSDSTSNELIIDTVATTITSPSVNEASPYAVFTVTGSVGREVSLTLANGIATGSGTDFGSSTPSNLQYSLDNGATWLDYASAITLTSTSFLVRTPLTNDATYEGAETFTLTATPSVGSAAVGTATIHDDGTGTIFNANGSVNNSTTPDNDTPVVSMSSVTVSEASPYAVVQVSLSHPSTSAISFTPSLTSGTGTVGIDAGSGLEYFNGTAWVSAASGVIIAPGNSSVLLRTAIVADDIYEGPETISVSTGPLAGTGVSSTPINGTVTIADDGSSSNVFNADTNSATPIVGEANNDLKSNDNDGVPESTESGLAQKSGSNAGDLNGDGTPDAQQTAVATLAWINNGNFENAVTGNLDSVPTNSIISLLVNGPNNVLDSNAQVQNIQVVPTASLPVPLPNSVSTTWDPISYAVAPTAENGLTDADNARSGSQQKVVINIANAGLDNGEFNRYMVYISADTINDYAEAGKPLKDLDGNALTNREQAGWYDFTARTTGGDGARYIIENGKITGIEITTTDGAFGDFSAVNGEFSYYGVPVSAAAQTVTSDSSITLADGIDNLMLNNVSKLAIPSTAACLPDWMAKMAGDAKQPVKTVANLNGTGNSWDNEITGNNGNNKLVGLDGNDTLTGLKGNDVLIGGNGADKLFGGAGKDSFKYLASTDSPSAAGQYDTIEDFKRGHDKIDLKNIDANTNKSGNQAFKLVNEFTNQAGQLHFDANTHLLQGDVNGDGSADFAIEITGVAKITATDILL